VRRTEDLSERWRINIHVWATVTDSIKHIKEVGSELKREPFIESGILKDTCILTR